MHLENTTTSAEEKQIDTRDLICPICMTVAEEPHLTSCCRRVFCEKDADPTKYDNGCPLCREVNYLFQKSSEHKSMVDKFTTKCICSERILPSEHEIHKERCSKVTVICPHKACQEKGDCKEYNSQELVSHFARAHCNEVPILGNTYINKKSLEPYKKISAKYDDLVATLYSVLYPKMIDIQIKTLPNLPETSSIFKCPRGHRLIQADSKDRKRKNGSQYSSPGFNCDICHQSFSKGPSWHCSCTDSGFDKCVGCIVFKLYDINNEVLQQASQDIEEQQHRYRPHSMRNTVRLPRGLFRLLAGSMDDDDDDILPVPHPSSFLNETSTYDGTDDDEIEVNLRQD